MHGLWLDHPMYGLWSGRWATWVEGRVAAKEEGLEGCIAQRQFKQHHNSEGAK